MEDPRVSRQLVHGEGKTINPMQQPPLAHRRYPFLSEAQSIPQP